MNTLESILSHSVGSHYKSVSSGVFRVDPKPKSDYLEKVIDFGSPYMYALVAGHFWEELARKGSATSKRYTSWFEVMAIHRLAMGGTFQVRKLERNQADEIKWDVLKLKEVPVEAIGRDNDITVNENFYNAWAGLQPPRSKMLNPDSTNLPVVDCADISGRGYQVTSAQDNHVISYEECGKILQKMASLKLYFVVPDWNAEKFSKNFKGVEKVEGKPKNKHTKKVEQYVLKLGVDQIKELSSLYEAKAQEVDRLFISDSLIRFNDNVEASTVRKRRRVE